MNVTIFEPVRDALTLQCGPGRLVDRAQAPRPSVSRMAVDVVETPQNIVVKASLPGCDKDHIEISFREGTLSIRARSEQTVAGESEKVLLHERQHGDVARTLAINVAVDADKATAGYADGVLTLTLPKAAQARSHRISIA